MGRKHCGKRRNFALQAISLFPAVFSKYMLCRRVKTRACLGKGKELIKKLLLRIVDFSNVVILQTTKLGVTKSAEWKALRKIGKMLVTNNFSFSHNFFFHFTDIPQIFQPHSLCHLCQEH